MIRFPGATISGLQTHSVVGPLPEILGIFAIAKIIEWLLNKAEGLTYSAILGLVISSPVVILMGTALSGIGAVTIVTGIIALVLGGIFALKLGGE